MKLWRVVAGVLALGFVAAGVTPAWACACGGYLPDADSQARAYGENALVRYSGGTEQITLSMAINGSSTKAAWIMPVPAAAKVELGETGVFASDRIVYPMRLSKGATTQQTVTVYVAAEHRVDATELPDPDVTPELLYAGRVRDDAVTAPADFLTAYSVTYTNPSRITDDFTFERSATDDEYQRVEYVTRNDGFLSTIGVLAGGVLLLGIGAAVIARIVVRRSSTGRDDFV